MLFVGSRGVLRSTAVAITALLVTGCLGHHSSAPAVPTVNVALHRRDIAEVAASTRPETPVHWTQVEAVRYAGTCPQRLGMFFDTVAQAGQPEAARVVRGQLAHLGVKV